ncbi:DUF459 domain-containing protein [Alsobacter sp. SYSU M60028]|uniref:DUF459 domain-containing protein n=1 Tax=Alsobacter ponti TaxID=2962936 RepID=A0ABT1LE14_9HYPH|nr:SGNH family hydrolase [Alsobacter ponti]MCP8939747.1 DUF459 domain-containing protein [Alsobacter ponti]
MNLFRLARFAVLALLLVAAGSARLAAQQPPRPPANVYPQREAAPEFRNPISDLLRLFSPAPPPPPVAAPRPAPRRAAPPVVVTDTPSPPKVDASVFIVVMGDTLGELLANGLAEAFDTNPDVEVVRRTRNNSGLVREDFYDWRKAAREIASGDKITQAVMMVGSNDRQAIRMPGGVTLDVLSEPWREAYGARVEEIARAFTERNIPLFWVGLPIMQNARMSADMLAINDIARARVQKAGGVFVDIWEAFADSENRYTVSGPALTGETVRLRAGDGVHFTRLGARKAAHFVETQIRSLLENRPPAPVIAVPSPETSEPSPDAALEPGGIERLIDEAARRGLEGLPPLPIAIPVKPVAGPILPLNQPESAPGARLLTGGVARGASEAGRLADQVLAQGRTPEAKPGRADDFRWPPPEP